MKLLIVIAIIAIVVANIILPIFFRDLDFFWMFKKSKPVPVTPPSDIEALDKEVDESVETFQNTKSKVDSVAEKVDQMKSKLN